MSSSESTQTGELVVVVEVVERPDGTVGLGNSLELTIGEAIEGIRAGKLKAENASLGVIPADWEE